MEKQIEVEHWKKVGTILRSDLFKLTGRGTFLEDVFFTNKVHFRNTKRCFFGEKRSLFRGIFCEDIFFSQKSSLLKLKKVPFWRRKYYIENLFILAKRKSYLFGGTFLSQITFTFETQKGLLIVKKRSLFRGMFLGPR